MTDIQAAVEVEAAAVKAEAGGPRTPVVVIALVVMGLSAEVLWLGVIGLWLLHLF
jgi:hypothetical protein